MSWAEYLVSAVDATYMILQNILFFPLTFNFYIQTLLVTYFFQVQIQKNVTLSFCSLLKLELARALQETSL